MVHANFVHLHVHTQYSLLDGACRLDRLVERAKKFKLPALAITDHGNLFGAIKFYNLCMKNGIKPIIGCEVYVAVDSRFKKDYPQGKESNYHLLLLAKDDVGYHNLIKLVSLAHLEGFYYRPRVDKELLNRYHTGLIACSACLRGEVSSRILDGDINGAYKCADEYLNIFGKGNFYLELMDNGLKEQVVVNKGLLKISRELNIPVVATNDVHYIDQDESLAHEVLLCIQTQSTLDSPKRFKFGGDTFYFRAPQEMENIFKDVPQAIKNTLEIMQKCNLVFDFSRVHLPHFPLPAGENEKDYLRKLCYENLKKRYPQPSDEVKRRLEYELSVIEKTGFSSYFLIVWDLVKFAKENGIVVGPGRGSAAGSIVSYILGITDIDPLRYNLLFERFLNPERISMPDIDMDFCYERRWQVLEYVANKYGKDNVAQIITFGTMLARAVVRDVGRVLGFSYADVDKIAKMIPSSVGHHAVDLKEALKINPELANIYRNDPKVKQLIDVAIKLEGLSRHSSTHAAGVVISDKPLMERTPVIKGAEGEIVTGFDMEDLEKIGLLKMDFLGLKTLTVIDNTIKIIRRTRGKDVNIDNIPLDDAKTFDLLAKGETSGVFQLESRGMRDLLQKMRPTKFEDLIAVLALYRPGPLGSGMVDDYIARRHGLKPVSYIHPLLEPILKETYGIILYQEQTMQIVSQLAGFSLSEADMLRKAIGKKIPEIMEEQKEKFVEGCRKNKIPPRTAKVIFDLIDYFSGYGFNKSHSTAYALISYRTAYLKANYGVEFMAALLTSERNNTDKVVEYVNEAGRMGIKVLPPDINESFADFTVTSDGNIRFGLMAIKNVGAAALENIISVRKERKFSDLADFCERVDSRQVNKKVVESLIKSGAMDGFGLRRAQMMVMLDRILEKTSKRTKTEKKQSVLFTTVSEDKVPDIEEWPISQILHFEKQLIGIYVSSHPLEEYKRLTSMLNLTSLSSLYDNDYRKEVSVMGVIEKVKFITTRKGNERMAIIKLEDRTSSVEAFVFPRVYQKSSSYLSTMKVVILKGALQSKDKVPKIIADDVYPVDEVFAHLRRVDIFVDKNSFNLKKLRDIFVTHKGSVPVCFILKNYRQHPVRIKTAQDFYLDVNEEVLEKLAAVVGRENISLAL